MFHEILVVDYIADFKSLSTDDIKRLSDRLVDSQFLTNCPNGTIIGVPIDGNGNTQKKVYYPFFSHISMPIKAGERAWSFERMNHQVSYWITRKVQNTSAEDLNFTHDDRAIIFPFISKDETDIRNNSRTFYDAKTSVLNLEKTRKSAISRSEFVGEPTAPLKSKSVDFTLQGSNGALINISNKGEVGTSTIDLAAGISEIKDDKKIQNSDGYEEAVKPVDSIILDADVKSIITISQKFNSDQYYKLPANDSGDVPTIALKTDSVRVIAKNDLKIVVGSNDSQSSMIIKSNGDIIITPGNTIKLSGDSSDQPYIRYDEHRRVITELENAITNLQAGLIAVAAVVDTIASGAASSAIIGPNTSVTSAISNAETAMINIGSSTILGS
jgi:hypothetical protein